ncbi:hypothetical protein SOVF_192530 [Spinacia oleracea]|nr:hypothetical protein SOVF_192530 [Spinacia oleracea]
MGDSTPSPMNSEAPTIDLAVVYANFLTQKPENSNDVLPSGGYNNNNPPLVELSSIPDATIIAPTSQVLLQVQLEHPNFSQPIPILPELMMNNNNHHDHNNNIDHQNQVVFVTEFSRSIHHQHDELGLPPLPCGDSLLLQDHHHHQQQQGIPWEASNLNDHHHHHHHHHNQDDSNINDDLESDSQFSNLFNNGSWSPLDLPGFETSSSSSKL